LREQFITDIQRLIGKMQTEGHDIVLMMDANESSSLGSGVDRLICKCGLADAHKSAQTTLETPATYQRGSKKIDFILISPRLVSSIRAAGILPLNEGYLSDHRALVVDFDPRILFGDNTSDIVAPSSRRLTSTNPNAVHQYIDFMRGFIQQHCLSERVDKLKERSEDTEPWSDAEVTEWEVLDSMLAQGQRAAEKRCPAKRSGQYPWSLEFEKARKKWLYWRLRTREITAKYTNQELLHELAESVNVAATDRQWLDSKTVFSKCREAKRQLTRVKKEAATLQEQHLQDMAKLAASLHNVSEKATRSAIAWREKTARQFNEARPLLNGVQSMGMD
jgi:hypothetical protein